jgi:hypothetical protein
MNKNKLNKGFFILKIILGVVLILVIFVAIYLYTTKKADTPEVLVPKNNLEILGNKEDLISFSVKPGDTVSKILSLIGSVQGYYYSEGNILIKLLDENQNILKEGNGTATTEWMTSDPVSFTATIDSTGLDGKGYILIQNDDPSGGEGGPAKKIFIPVVFKP